MLFFSRFDEKDSVSGVQQLKSSVQKGIRSKLLELYPHLEGFSDQIIPKKDAFRIVKWYKIFKLKNFCFLKLKTDCFFFLF